MTVRMKEQFSTINRVSQFLFRFPNETDDLDQDREWFEVKIDDEWTRLRIHDYESMYKVPGLYEALVYQRLKCMSPTRVVGLLNDVISDAPDSPDELRVLDVGAGNGIVGTELRSIGAARIYGVDIVEEASVATMRDRPGIYDDYFVEDLTNLSTESRAAIIDARLNCLTVVAALGFDDIPPQVFLSACNLIQSRGWLAFNIKEDFLNERVDESGFAALIHRLQLKGKIRIHAYRRYRHRLSIDDEPLYYVAMVATKLDSFPLSLADS